MPEKISKVCFSILFSLLILITAHLPVCAQKKSEIVSGEYESLIIAVNASGELTGYFDEGAGDDGKGNPLFNCSFFIYGWKQPDGTYKIATWYPGEVDDFIDGELKYTKADGSAKINLHLNGEHGGCWNVAPVLKEKGGVAYDLTKAENWTSIRVVSAAKTFFYASAEAKTPQKSYLVKNDVVRVLQTKDDTAQIIFVSAKGKITSGWIKTKDFYNAVPPPLRIK